MLAVKKCAIPYVPPRTEAAMRSTPLLRVVSTFWEHTMMTVRTRYRGRQAWMAGTSADRDRHTAITADVPNQNLMPYCRYRFSLQMATTVAKQQPGALRRKPASAYLCGLLRCQQKGAALPRGCSVCVIFWQRKQAKAAVRKQQVPPHCIELVSC